MALDMVRERYPVRERVLAELKTSDKWIAIQSVGMILTAAATLAASIFIDRYIPPDPSANLYSVGILGFLMVRAVAWLLPLLVAGAIAYYLLYPGVWPYVWYIWSVFMVGPLILGRAYYALYILGPLIGIPLFWIRVKSVTYVITDKKLVIKDTWLSREAKGRIYSKLSNVVLKQSVMGRIFGYGSIVPLVGDLEAYGVAAGPRPIMGFAIEPMLTNSIFQVSDPERAWKSVMHLVQYRDMSETFERVGEKIVNRLERIERRVSREPPTNMYV